jgi:general secretion pathway protein L
MSTLLVLLPTGPVSAASEFAFAVSTDRRTVLEQGRAVASLLPLPHGADADTVAVVPVHALSWHQVDLPKGVAPGTPRLRTVLESLLEERLLDEPSSLHIAVQPGATSGPVWVAACDRAWLRGALAVLEAAGRAPQRIVPEFSPQPAPRLDAIGDAGSAQLVATSAQGVLLLPLQQASLALLQPLDDIPCSAEPAVAELAEQVLLQKVALQQAPQRWLQAAQEGWDLAQFEFATGGHARLLKRLAAGWTEFLRAPHWRPARWGAAALLAVQVIGLNAWAFKERSALAAKREAVRTTLTQTFPQVKVVVDAPLQMAREVAALRQVTGASSGRDLESMLTALAMSAPPGRSVSSVDYTGGELRARGLALDADTLRPVAANLRSMGYSATLQGDVLVIGTEASP